MKKILTLVFVFAASFLACGFSGDRDAKREEAVRSLYGRIFVTNNSAAADFRVCVVKSIAQADLCVYVAPNASCVGRWEFVKERSRADFSICYTYLASADVAVCFVSGAALAGRLRGVVDACRFIKSPFFRLPTVGDKRGDDFVVHFLDFGLSVFENWKRMFGPCSDESVICFAKVFARGLFYVFSFVSALICIFAVVPYLPPFKGYWIVAYVVFFGVCFAWFVIRLRADTLRRIRERELAEEAEEREKYFNAKRERESLELNA